MEKELTIIIPFANEGEEVGNTIKSILRHSSGEVCIILINDASDDGFDYEQSLKQFPIKYVINKSRLGVAASRDKGVKLCETKYFLLLDSHMRFYDSDWVSIICQELKNCPNQLLCAQTKVLVKKMGKFVKVSKLDFIGEHILIFIPHWSF